MERNEGKRREIGALMKSAGCSVLISCLTLFMLTGLAGCSYSNPVNVNVENSEKLDNQTLGFSNFTEIGDGLYYDSATRIVYIKILTSVGYMSPYYAPNGLPYRYNPETNTFEEIDNCCEHCSLKNSVNDSEN